MITFPQSGLGFPFPLWCRASLSHTDLIRGVLPGCLIFSPHFLLFGVHSELPNKALYVTDFLFYSLHWCLMQPKLIAFKRLSMVFCSSNMACVPTYIKIRLLGTPGVKREATVPERALGLSLCYETQTRIKSTRYHGRTGANCFSAEVLKLFFILDTICLSNIFPLITSLVSGRQCNREVRRQVPVSHRRWKCRELSKPFEPYSRARCPINGICAHHQEILYIFLLYILVYLYSYKIQIYWYFIYHLRFLEYKGNSSQFGKIN